MRAAMDLLLGLHNDFGYNVEHKASEFWETLRPTPTPSSDGVNQELEVNNIGLNDPVAFHFGLSVPLNVTGYY